MATPFTTGRINPLTISKAVNNCWLVINLDARPFVTVTKSYNVLRKAFA